MNFLKKYSKLSRISYTSIRTFAYNAKPSNAPIGSGTRNPYSASETTNSGIGIRSASIPGGSSRNPEHITSTDTRFNSFHASGPTSGFSDSGSQDLGSSTKTFADSTASSLKNLADQAANTAKGFVDQAQGRDDSVNRNRSRSPIDDLVDTANSVAQGFGNLAQGAVSAATSFGSNFIPRDQRNQQQNVSEQNQRPAYYDQHDYNRDMAIRNTGRYGSQDSRYTASSYDPTQDIGKFVDSTARNIQDSANQAANRARDTFDQATGNTFAATSQGENSNVIGSTLQQAQAIAGTAANIAGYAVKGMMDNAAYFASAFVPSSTSSSSTKTSPHTERSAAFNSQQTNNYGYVYNPGYTSTENKRVEHIISTDTRYNAFSSAGHVSGFGAPWVRNSTPEGFNSDVRRFADNAASNIKGAVDQAADTAKDFVDRGSNYANSTGNPAADIMNQAASTAQALAGQTAYMIGSTLNSFVNVATSVANSMNPSQQQNREMYVRDQNYMNNYDERRPQNFTSTDTRSNFFNPGQGSGDHPISPFDNPIGNFVSSMAGGNPITSMIQGAVSTGFNLASNFVPGAQSQSQNPNLFRQNQYSSPEDRPRNLAAETVDNAVKGAANVAQGLANAANSIASTFIPGGGQNRNPSGQR